MACLGGERRVVGLEDPAEEAVYGRDGRAIGGAGSARGVSAAGVSAGDGDGERRDADVRMERPGGDGDSGDAGVVDCDDSGGCGGDDYEGGLGNALVVSRQ